MSRFACSHQTTCWCTTQLVGPTGPAGTPGPPGGNGATGPTGPIGPVGLFDRAIGLQVPAHAAQAVPLSRTCVIGPTADQFVNLCPDAQPCVAISLPTGRAVVHLTTGVARAADDGAPPVSFLALLGFQVSVGADCVRASDPACALALSQSSVQSTNGIAYGSAAYVFEGAAPGAACVFNAQALVRGDGGVAFHAPQISVMALP